MRTPSFLGLLAGLASVALSAQTIPEGPSLVPTGLDGYSSTGAGAFEILPVDHAQFHQAVRVTIQRRTGNFWDSQWRAPITASVSRREVALIRFFMRAEPTSNEMSEALVQVYLQRSTAPHNKSVNVQLSAGSRWKEHFVPFQFDASYDPGEAELVFGFGGVPPQSVEIGGIDLVHYGDSLALKDLPSTSLSYPGQDLNAPWRVEAAKRIDEHRKGPLKVIVAGESGAAVPDARVTVELKRHAFDFGSALQAWRLLDGSQQNETYRAKAKELFNAATFENALKWPAFAGDWGRGRSGRDLALQALQWLGENEFDIRGHVMVWPGWRHLPRDVRNLRDDPSAIPGLVKAHIRDAANATRPFVPEWDVVNEPISNHDLMDLFGNEIMVDWFKTAREELPQARLYLNDYGILSNGGYGAGKQDAVEQTLRFLLDHGAPVDGLGMQGHFGGTLTAPPRLLEIVDRFAAMGLDIRVTEFDIDIADEQVQADYTRDFITAMFSHPAVVGVQFWGFWESAHWKPRAAMHRADWTEKPNGKAFRTLVHETWHTEESGVTDRDGIFAARGFFGAYDITVIFGAREWTIPFELTPESNTVRVTLAD